MLQLLVASSNMKILYGPLVNFHLWLLSDDGLGFDFDEPQVMINRTTLLRAMRIAPSRLTKEV